jgi:hypothetical protein
MFGSAGLRPTVNLGYCKFTLMSKEEVTFDLAQWLYSAGASMQKLAAIKGHKEESADIQHQLCVLIVWACQKKFHA